MNRWIAPFPRLRFRVRHGYWCSHRFGAWQMIETGKAQLRRCFDCEHVEFR